MPKMVIVVMPNIEVSRDVMQAWSARGVSGITVIESLGWHKVQEHAGHRDDLPLFLSLRHLMQGQEFHHRTAFTIVDDDFDVPGLIEATERAIGGDFNAPDSGVLFVLPVLEARGLRPHWKCTES